MYKKILRYLKTSKAARSYKYWALHNPPDRNEPFARSLVQLFNRLEREKKKKRCYKK